VLVTILTVAELVYVVVLAVWILMEKRPPVSTLAWIFALIALPYVGFVVFFLLGPRRLVRRRLKHRKLRKEAQELARAAAAEAPPPPADPRIQQLAHLASHAGEPPCSHATGVTIFHDAASTFDAIEAAIMAAKSHIHVAYYIFDPRRSGTRFRDALIARAKAGVTVRLLVDHVGSSTLKGSFLKPMRDAGIHFARFNQVNFPAIRNRVDFRMHRKIVVVDGTVGFTGGINISDDYLPPAPDPRRDKLADRRHERGKRRRGHSAPWRDTHVRFTGDAVRGLQLTFLDDWFFATGYAAREKELFPPVDQAGPHQVQVVSSGPDRDGEAIQRLYFAAITSARERVLVTTPYFVPDDPILTALETAAMRGVDVRVLVPRRSDSLIVTAAARSYYDACLSVGVRFFEYQPTMIHSKTLVVDDFFAAVGTANMDNRSFRLNFEVTAVIYGPDAAADLADQFTHDLTLCREVKPADRKKVSLGWRLAEAGARVLSPIL